MDGFLMETMVNNGEYGGFHKCWYSNMDGF